MAHAYPTLAQAKLALHRVGDMITQDGTPKDFGPLVYAFTGNGNVAHVRKGYKCTQWYSYIFCLNRSNKSMKVFF